MIRPATLAFVLAAAAACSSAKPLGTSDARRADDDAVVAKAAEIDAAEHARHYVVVQDGAIVASASLPDDAVRAAAKVSPSPSHRFVFRPQDRGSRLYRLAYLAEGGIVAGRAFLTSLGLDANAKGPSGRPLIRARAGAASIDLGETPRLVLELTSLDGAAKLTISAVYDPDFDGSLLVTKTVAGELGLARSEIPGMADVQVALGRPFRGHRAVALAKLPALTAAGPVELVYEAAPLGQ